MNATLFPGFLSEAEVKQITDAGLRDGSWGNDAAPFWYLPNNNDPVLGLMTDHPDFREREITDPHGKRFAVINHSTNDLLLETDDLSTAIEKFKATAKELKLIP